jgi:protein CrcB
MPVRRIDRRSDGRFDVNYRLDGRLESEIPMQRMRAPLDSAPSYSQQQEPGESGSSLPLPASYTASSTDRPLKMSPRVTTLYTISYLVFFALVGTLIRIGLNTVTFFPGAPIVFSSLWANFAGTLLMGFLTEDRMLFKEEWGVPKYDMAINKAATMGDKDALVDLSAAKKAHGATKKTIPLFIGLATGLCGSITSFSSFIRDAVLALTNNLPSPLNHPVDFTVNGTALTTTSTTVSRDAVHSIMALLAVVIVTLCVFLMALRLGITIAADLGRYTPTIPFIVTRRFLDGLTILLGFGGWIIAIVLSISPPDNNARGIALFSLVFSPIGCLGRFYASMLLNARYPPFPLGTFVVNILGTVILGVAFVFQHSKGATIIECQVLQGVIDGFCGCLTTISTFAVELTTLKQSHARIYGISSIGIALGLLVAIMGTFAWAVGLSEPVCVT